MYLWNEENECITVDCLIQKLQLFSCTEHQFHSENTANYSSCLLHANT